MWPNGSKLKVGRNGNGIFVDEAGFKINGECAIGGKAEAQKDSAGEYIFECCVPAGKEGADRVQVLNPRSEVRKVSSNIGDEPTKSVGDPNPYLPLVVIELRAIDGIGSVVDPQGGQRRRRLEVGGIDGNLNIPPVR